MLEPNGPLPPEIYWRRRALAIGVAVVVIGMVVWLIVSLTGGSSNSPQPSNTGLAAGATSKPATTTGSVSGSVIDTGDPGSNSAVGADGSTSAPSAGAAGAAGASASPGAAATPTSGTPVAAGQCPDQSLAVKATPDQATYPSGQQPSFTVIITNISSTACSRELGAGLQQALVYTIDNKRLWSNIDCFPNTASDVRNLAPGAQAGFKVAWSGTTSDPGCTTPRVPVAPGAYVVVAQLGELRSSPEPFNIS